MESDTRAEKMEIADVLESSSCGNLYSKILGVLEAEVVDECSRKMINVTASVPMTPDTERENREASVGVDTPLTCVLSPLRGASSDSDVVACQTPKENIFNPFAPGPEELMFAPKKRTLEDNRFSAARRLNFECGVDFEGNVEDIDLEDPMHEEDFLESYCESLIDEIVSKQAEGVISKNLTLEYGVGRAADGFKTPDSSPLLNGAADTCPGAPTRPSGKSRKLIDAGICRKLEF